MTFTDTEVETAKVFRQFMKLLARGEIEASRFDKVDKVDLAIFMMQWECAGAVETYCSLITKAVLEQGLSPTRAFTIGAVLDNEQLCRVALSQLHWTYDDEVKTSRGMVKGCAMDPNFLHWDVLFVLPRTYHYALVWAWREVGQADQLPDVFSWHLKCAKSWGPRLRKSRPFLA